MANTLQEEYANALETLRNERERASKLESLNDHLQNELERAQHLLFLAENPNGVAAPKLVPQIVMVPADQTDAPAADTTPLYTDNIPVPDAPPIPVSPKHK